MNERSNLISKLVKTRNARESYIRSKLSVLLPAQIRSLRLRRGMKQADLGVAAEMKQARISVLERIGEVSFSIETLIKLASAFRVGLSIKFVPMSEMLKWEDEFQPDTFDIVPIEEDMAFIHAHQQVKQYQASPGMIQAMIGAAVLGSNQTNLTTIAATGTVPKTRTSFAYNSNINEADFAMAGALGYGENNQTRSGFWPAMGLNNDSSDGVAA